MSASCAYSVRPSLHSRKRSPASTSKSSVSTSTLSYTPTARVTAFFMLSLPICSGVSCPRLSSSLISEWSSVSCCTAPPRTRYMRESPTCARKPRLPTTSSATSVVPMPRLLHVALRLGEHRGARLLHRRARASAAPSLRSAPPRPCSNASSVARSACSVSRNACTAMLLATSPAAWPPMPSATTNRCSALVDEEVVLVAVAQAADVGQRPEAQRLGRYSS